MRSVSVNDFAVKCTRIKVIAAALFQWRACSECIVQPAQLHSGRRSWRRPLSSEYGTSILNPQPSAWVHTHAAVLVHEPLSRDDDYVLDSDAPSPRRTLSRHARGWRVPVEQIRHILAMTWPDPGRGVRAKFVKVDSKKSFKQILSDSLFARKRVGAAPTRVRAGFAKVNSSTTPSTYSSPV